MSLNNNVNDQTSAHTICTDTQGAGLQMQLIIPQISIKENRL